MRFGAELEAHAGRAFSRFFHTAGDSLPIHDPHAAQVASFRLARVARELCVVRLCV
jgi:hypothetical protein